MSRYLKIAAGGLLGGFLGNGVMGAIFSAPPIQSILYSPSLQSDLFREITPTRNIPVSVAGLVILGVAYAWLFDLFRSSVPGSSAVKKGLFWGATIWIMYWVPQEWFIYHTLLREPLLLCSLELSILLLGSLVQGVVISLVVSRGNPVEGGPSGRPAGDVESRAT